MESLDEAISHNPVTWRRNDGLESTLEEHLGSYRGGEELKPKSCVARVEEKGPSVFIEDNDGQDYRGWASSSDFPRDYHVSDYAIFWMDIRRNVELRIETYLREHPEPLKENVTTFAAEAPEVTVGIRKQTGGVFRHPISGLMNCFIAE